MTYNNLIYKYFKLFVYDSVYKRFGGFLMVINEDNNCNEIFDEIIKSRRSTRFFTEEFPSKEIIEDILNLYDQSNPINWYKSFFVKLEFVPLFKFVKFRYKF